MEFPSDFRFAPIRPYSHPPVCEDFSDGLVSSCFEFLNDIQSYDIRGIGYPNPEKTNSNLHIRFTDD